jgi:hypothetical protein
MPTVAIWLLRTFGSGASIDALIGDLVEEARGRSAWWVWGQALTAIVVTAAAEIRVHPVLTLRAVGTGLASVAILTAGWVVAMPWVSVTAEVYLPAGQTEFAFHRTADGMFETTRFALSWQRIYYDPAIVLLAVLTTAAIAAAVVRLTHHRQRSLALLLGLIAVRVAWRLWIVSVASPGPPPDDVWLPDSRLAVGMWVALIPWVAIGGLLLGGYGFSRRRHLSTQPLAGASE